MKIDYIVISSDDNSLYKDFYEIVAKRWNQLGLKVYYINITNEDQIIENEYGIIHKIKSIDGFSTGFQSQIVRLFSSNLIEGNILTSDIDMIPLNGEYFISRANKADDDKILIYSGQPYADVPYYQICYILSNTKLYRECLGISDLSFYEFCHLLKDRYGEAWNSDEHFMYDQFQNHLEKLDILRDRDLSWGGETKRIDRSNWSYDVNLLKNNYYIDSHLLRPYTQYKKNIDELLENINCKNG
jgi:hypothetical protein